MNAAVSSQRDSPPSRHQWQFSLRLALLCVLALSIVLAICSQFPRQSAFTVLMTLLLLFPLASVAALRMPLVRLGIISDDGLHGKTSAPQGPITKMLMRAFRLSGLWQPDNGPSLMAGFTTALISTITLIGLWPALREIGLLMAVASVWPVGQIWQYALRSVPDALSRSSYWLRLWQWEVWSLGRWWLLFGALIVMWLAVSSPFHRGRDVGRTSRMLARFLAFTPWFIVLEVAFLIGVWIESPTTVPEPSTGFVVGIFSWDLWHWDCWLDHGWLIRGAVPTFIAGSVFFVHVLRWPWTVGVIAALILVPIALMLSVACTVAYQNGFPQLL